MKQTIEGQIECWRSPELRETGCGVIMEHNNIPVKSWETFIRKEKSMKRLILCLCFLLIGCASQTDKLLTDVGYKFKKQGDCQVVAERQAEYLKGLSYQAEVVHCDARSKYEWDHAICKAYIDGQWWVVPDGKVMDIPWEYNEVKKACYDFILPLRER